MHIVSSFSCERKGGNRLIAALFIILPSLALPWLLWLGCTIHGAAPAPSDTRCAMVLTGIHLADCQRVNTTDSWRK